jgi:hypothetical protein
MPSGSRSAKPVQPSSSDRGNGVCVYTIIVHTSPASDAGAPHWTEAPQCPAAHEGGRTAEEAVALTKQRIKAWRAAHGTPADEAVEFRVEHAR